MITYTGTHVTQGFGAPNLRDIAVQGMRLTRFNGAGKIFWPIGMHTLLVADIVVEQLAHRELEHHALLHDAAEMAGINDISRPMKMDDQRDLEHRLLARIYRHLGFRMMKDGEQAIIKQADALACNAEGALGAGPRGYMETQTGFRRNKIAEGLMRNLLASFKIEDAMNADGRWPLYWEKRTRKAIRNIYGNPEAFSNPA